MDDIYIHDEKSAALVMSIHLIISTVFVNYIIPLPGTPTFVSPKKAQNQP